MTFMGNVSDLANELGVPIYNSTDELTPKLYDYANVFWLPAVCLFGMITSSINISVLIKTKLADKIHFYMMTSSVSDLLFLMIQFSLVVIRCGTLCPYGYTYGAKFFELYIYLYAGYVIITFTALVDVSVSIDRLISFQNKRTSRSRRNFRIRCSLLFVLAAVLQSPFYLVESSVMPLGILSKNSGTTFEILYTQNIIPDWYDPAHQVPMTVLSLIDGPILMSSILLIDLIVAFKFQAHLKQKEKICKSVSSHDANISIEFSFTLIF